MKIIYKIFIIILFINTLQAQETVGKWNEYFSFNNILAITQNNNGQIIAAAENGYFIPTDQNNFTKISKINGLSDIGISTIAFASQTNKLIVGYQNGNIDIVANQIFNLPYIKDNQLNINKIINQILPYKNQAFIATGFGIIKLNLINNQIDETYILSNTSEYVQVYSILIYNDTLFAATEYGLFKITTNQNMIDFNNWIKDNFFNHKKVYKIVLFNNKPTALFQDGQTNKIAIKQNNSWQIIFNDINTQNIYANNQNLFIIKENKIEAYNTNLLKIKEISQINGQTIHPNTIFTDKDNTLYIGDKYIGLIKYSQQPTIICPNAPLTNDIFYIKIKNQTLYALHGGYDLNFNNQNKPAQIYIYQNNQWQNLSFNNVVDFCSIAIDPKNDTHLFVGSWNYGIYELNNYQITNHYSQINGNSNLKPALLQYDNYGILWSYCKNDPPIYTLINKQWKTSNLTSTRYYLPQKVIFKNDQMFVAYDSRGILAAKYSTDNQNIIYSSVMLFYPPDQNGEKIGNKILSIAIDEQNNVWLATDDGIGILSNIDFENKEYNSSRVMIQTVEQDTVIINYLFKGSIINDIELDPANRIWIATNSGVYLLNENGTEQIYHFTKQNSPLPTNEIKQIAINQNNGEVFFATKNGLISFFADAAEAKQNFNNAYVYPNPVKHDYNGNIIIKGLMKNTTVKITDISGNLIYQTTSNGSIATWNGKTFNGKKPATGVYLIFLTNEEATISKTLKLLIIN